MDGWIDLQVNGYAGVDFNAPGLTVEKVLAVTEKLAADGTVGYLPTLVTGDPEMLIGMVRTVMEARRKYAICEKNILGFFLEGPFISDKPGAVGTHPVEWVHAPDMGLFNRFQDAAEGLVRMVNVAAEVPGMPAFVRAVTAEGVHVGQRDMSPAEVRAIVGARCEIGLSITAVEQVAAIDRRVVDAIGIGPVYDARKTKADAAAAMGPDGLREIVARIPDIANCAIGGITLANGAEVMAAGAKGLAVVSAFSKSEDPYAVARQFSLLFDHCGQ